MIYYKPVKITINALSFTKIIINIVIRYYDLLNFIILDQSLLFISKFWFLLCYFLGIKQKLFMAFYTQISSQIKS